MKSKLKPLFPFIFPLIPSQKRDWEILYFETNSTFTAVQMYQLQIYYWLTAAWGEIPGFVYVHRCFWKVYFLYFLYFVLPANLIYHLLPWKHGLFSPPPSKMAVFQFSLCCSASLIHASPVPQSMVNSWNTLLCIRQQGSQQVLVPLLCVQSTDNKPSMEFSELRARCVTRQKRHLQVGLFAVSASCLTDTLCSWRGFSWNLGEWNTC